MVSRHVGKGDSWKKEGEGEARISSGVKVAARLEKKGRLRRRAKEGTLAANGMPENLSNCRQRLSSPSFLPRLALIRQ